MKYKLLVVVILFLSTVSSLALDIKQTTISSIVTTDKGVTLVYYVGGTVAGASPACAVVKDRFSIKSQEASGKAHLASAMMAFTLKLPVDVYGGNSCLVWSNTEDLKNLWVKSN